jgi:ankyrin repeat protein
LWEDRFDGGRDFRKDEHGRTALHAAAYLGNRELATVLLDAGRLRRKGEESREESKRRIEAGIKGESKRGIEERNRSGESRERSKIKRRETDRSRQRMETQRPRSEEAADMHPQTDSRPAAAESPLATAYSLPLSLSLSLSQAPTSTKRTGSG